MTGNGIRVLVVDDDADAGLRISIPLDQNGYNVLQVYDGAHALLELHKRRFDVVILSFPRSAGCGMELLRRMHAQGIETQVILMSSSLPHTSSGDAGVRPFAWLRTPYTGPLLLGLVRAATYAAPRSCKGNASLTTMAH